LQRQLGEVSRSPLRRVIGRHSVELKPAVVVVSGGADQGFARRGHGEVLVAPARGEIPGQPRVLWLCDQDQAAGATSDEHCVLFLPITVEE